MAVFIAAPVGLNMRKIYEVALLSAGILAVSWSTLIYGQAAGSRMLKYCSPG